MIEQIFDLGWKTVKAGCLIVCLCTLLHLITGAASGAFITSVYNNTLEFLQKIPSGTFLGLVLIVVLLAFFQPNKKS